MVLWFCASVFSCALCCCVCVCLGLLPCFVFVCLLFFFFLFLMPLMRRFPVVTSRSGVPQATFVSAWLLIWGRAVLFPAVQINNSADGMLTTNTLPGTLHLALVLVLLCWQDFLVIWVSAARPGTESYYDSYRPELKSPTPSIDKMPKHPTFDEYSSSVAVHSGDIDAALKRDGSKATATFKGWHRLAAGEILVSCVWLCARQAAYAGTTLLLNTFSPLRRWFAVMV